ncbi:MAG: formylglycine-generating enzyme family protein [Kiritimatiellae bacterium]|nr:formylglycine-generating enzyme family protein [Kiritimatiellia bacterium]
MKSGSVLTTMVAAVWVSLAAIVAGGLTGCKRAPKGPKAGTVKTISLPGGATMEMVWCPPGTFKMGTPGNERPERPEEEEDWDAKHEKPHKVTLSKGFWMAKTEVTQGQWKSVMGRNPSKYQNGDNQPVEEVSWEDCQEFCKKAGNGLRLPTEAEWEYACRAGSTTAYSWGDALNGDKAACNGNIPHGFGSKQFGPRSFQPKPVGSYAPNAWGLYDMHGNVSEWCADLFGPYPDGAVTDPKGAADGERPVLRGGCWANSAWKCRSAYRTDYASWTESTGFRPVCSISETEMAKPNEKKATESFTEPSFQDKEGIAETAGDGAGMKLLGLFGVRFGQQMPESETCETNSSGNRVYSFKSGTFLEKFGDCTIFATPTSRRVSGIRTTYVDMDMVGIARETYRESGQAEDEALGALIAQLSQADGGGDDIGEVFEETIRVFERRFNRSAKREATDTARFLFANTNVVIVKKIKVPSGHAHVVLIDAVDIALRKLAEREAGDSAAQ